MGNLISLKKNDLDLKERWEISQQYKQNFFTTHCENYLMDLPIDPEITASWIRSYHLGVDPHQEIVGQSMPQEKYQEILEQNSLLIDIVKPLVNIYKNLMISSDYNLELIDSHGISLLQEGEISLCPWQGKIFDESIMGTNAHSLCMHLNRPIQLFGPEHYCIALQNIVASAVPLVDKLGNIMGSLVLTQPIVVQSYEDQSMFSHTLGLITAMAAAVELQIKLKESNDHLLYSNDCLKTAYDTIKATLACIDEGIVTIDRTGKILHANKEGIKLLRLKPEEVGKRIIIRYLDRKSTIMSHAARGDSASVEETFYFENDEQTYMVNIKPVLDDYSGQLSVAVLRLIPIEKINSMVANRSGATASFQFNDIVGESKPLKDALGKAQRFAKSGENILLIGESGTGKELFAQSIHNHYCPSGPFMAVNCAALPRELIESELFGYEGGSFTGAERSGRPGKIELAHGGTLFLDEIGDMPLELQSVLLRVLEDKQVMRVGGRRYKKVEFRLIAATNKALPELVKEKLFREDLYFRLSVLSIQLPPLRKREKDIEILSNYFIQKYCRKMDLKNQKFSSDAQKMFNNYDWPGNIRQLENAVYYALNMAEGEVVEVKDLPEYLIQAKNPLRIYANDTYEEKLEEILSLRNLEKSAIELALLHTHNSIPRAAALLEISKATLYRKLKEYNYENINEE